MTAFGTYLAQTFVMLFVIILLAALVLWTAKKLGVGRPMGSMKLMGRLPLDARRSVFLIQIGKRVLVVGSSEAGLTKLAELDATQVPPTSPDEPPTTFSSVLERLRTRAKAPTEAPDPTTQHQESSDT